MGEACFRLYSDENSKKKSEGQDREYEDPLLRFYGVGAALNTVVFLGNGINPLP
jgi:hypothetical protein